MIDASSKTFLKNQTLEETKNICQELHLLKDYIDTMNKQQQQ